VCVCGGGGLLCLLPGLLLLGPYLHPRTPALASCATSTRSTRPPCNHPPTPRHHPPQVGTILRTISMDSLEMVSEVGAGPSGATFSVNLQRIIDVLRLKSLEAVVRDRWVGGWGRWGRWGRWGWRRWGHWGAGALAQRDQRRAPARPASAAECA
jgi:hypothetical protein